MTEFLSKQLNKLDLYKKAREDFNKEIFKKTLEYQKKYQFKKGEGKVRRSGTA